MKRLLAALLLVALAAVFLLRQRQQPVLQQATVFAFGTTATLQGVCPPADWDNLRARSVQLLTELEREFARGGDGFAGALHALPRPVLPLRGSWPDIIRFADALYRHSGGAYDPTVIPLLDLYGLWGDTLATMPPDPRTVRALLPRVNWGRHVHLTGSDVTIDTGSEAFFGSLAEGFALEQLVTLWRATGITDGIIELGGDVAVLGRHPSGRAWKIGVQDPLLADRLFSEKEVAPRHGETLFVATSGDYERGYEYDGVRYHHIIDPRTGIPARSGWHSATVIAPRGMVADALATTLVVLGRPDALADTYGYRALLVGAAGRTATHAWEQP